MLPQRPRRARRVQLAVPGSSDRMMANAAASAADHVFLDLEDAVAPSAKEAARARVVAALHTLDWTGKTRCVRINDLTTRYAYEDIIAVVEGAGTHLDTVILPKAMGASDVQFVATLLHQIEQKIGLDHQIGIEVLIEEVQALQNVEAIAAASPRVEALILGMGDFSASMGIDQGFVGSAGGYSGDLWHYARFRLGMAARAAGIDAIDGPFPDFKDSEAYARECRNAFALGFVGKWAIHPAQIAPALAAFTPDPAAVDNARRMRAAFLAATAQGLGATTFEGKMVDAASLRILQNTLDKADLYGM
ncbi:MAG: CoA ester lyase [Rhodospirillales bacterium]|nr:CoA ester lyase [Rhodospirillales bacterium]